MQTSVLNQACGQSGSLEVKTHVSQADHPPPLSKVQLEIMNVVWSQGEVTVSEVWKAFLADRQISRGSVQTMMLRLEEKGWLSHREVGQAFLYKAVYPREATQQRLALQLADGVFGGSTEGLIWSLLQSRGVSKEEAERLHDMIDEAERKRKRKKRTRKS